MPRVQSEALNGATCDPERRLLTLEFESGSVYEYLDVEPELSPNSRRRSRIRGGSSARG